VEKETVFTSLGSHPGFLEASKCILLTGKGYPDYAARLLLESIAKSYPGLPILVLTDADPHGLHIALTYHAALPANAAFHFIGVRPSDRDGVLSNLTDEVLLPLKPAETVLAQNLVATITFPQAAGATSALQDIVTELQYCLDSCAKFEIEALITLDNSYCMLIEYLKLRVGDILTNSSIASL
jgi:DNA topoisomerase VI subunit A